MMTFTLNEEQEEALDMMEEFIYDSDDHFFTLSGYAGTGKTVTITRLIERMGKGYNFAFTAPTNKAVRVLQQNLDAINSKSPALTIYSLLGLIMMADGGTKVLKKPVGLEAAFPTFEIIIVDEASMIGQELYDKITEAAIEANNKVIFLGDPAQLPPVKEIRSPVFEPIDQSATLTKIMRYDNHILKLASEIRRIVDFPLPTIILADHATSDESSGIIIEGRNAFENTIMQTARDWEFLETNKLKVIAWRNITVDRYNKLIRACMFVNPAQWEVTDRIIATGPCNKNELRLLTTDEEAEILSINNKQHEEFPQYQSVRIEVKKDNNRTVHLQVLTAVGSAELQKELSKLKKEQLWGKFWKLAEAFHPIRHAYAITAHRSQGSTYETVFVDSKDILCNRNRQEAFRCLYVACTRASKFVIIT